jgi:3-methylcrotonyl-CoA carboxylase alpha subunit
MASRTVTLNQADDDRTHSVEVVDAGGGGRADAALTVRVEQRAYSVARDREGSLRITSEETNRTTTAWSVAVGDVRWVFIDGRVFELAEMRPLTRPRSRHHGPLVAPMPATVRRVLVRAGDTVKHGDALVILEAMKMELPVRADTPGLVRAVLCREGELVQPGVALIEIDGD